MPFVETVLRKWAEGQAREWLAKEFAALGKDNLLWLIDRNRSILEFYPVEKIDSLKRYAPLVRDADLLTWLSADTLAVLRSHPQGEAWGREQMRLLKERLGV